MNVRHFLHRLTSWRVGSAGDCSRRHGYSSSYGVRPDLICCSFLMAVNLLYHGNLLICLRLSLINTYN